MVTTAEQQLGPLPDELRRRFRVTAATMVCEYVFRGDGTITVTYDTNPESSGVETGHWTERDGKVVAELTETAAAKGKPSGQRIRRVLHREHDYLVLEHPQTRVRWYLRRTGGVAGGQS